jgi:hypothetical protein
MQSILQYRRFRRRLEGQIERHGLEKVASSSVRPPPALTRSLSTGPHHLQEIRTDAIMSDRHHAFEEARLEKGLAPQELNGEVNRTSGSAHRDLNTEKPHRIIDDNQNSENTPKIYHDIATSSTVLAEGSRTDTGPHLDSELTRCSLSSSSSSSSVSAHDQVPVRLTTVSTHRTQMSTEASIGQTLTGVDVHSPRTNEKGHDSGGHVFVVGYQGLDDTLNPHNWSTTRRICYTLLIALIGLIVGFASSIDSAAAPQAAEEFHVSEVTESLATSMYLLGFGFGAPFAAPLSETFGRNVVYISTLSLFMVWVMASALAPNIGAQLIFRLLAGFFGSTPLTCAGGSISDMWDATERTAIFPVFANSAFWGPILGMYHSNAIGFLP